MTSTVRSTLWIGPLDHAKVGDVGFLVQHSHNLKGWIRHDLRLTPAHTNQSQEPRLDGWCGTYNDVATHADGMVRVERVAKNERVLVKRLAGDELTAALEELGYPELAET